jgi:uncharacterized protein (TIGR00661 family)
LAEKINIRQILVAPLDWGLGHATRCIPIIKSLVNAGHNVIIAGNATQQSLLRAEFPNLTFIVLNGYGISYASSKRILPLKILWQVPKILKSIRKENVWLNKVVDEYKIDLVISDNRFGMHTKKCPCIFITHQLTIKMPYLWLQNFARRINYHFINKFTACWVPDIAEENNVAGILSHPKVLPNIPVHYLGLLSRFTKLEVVEKKFDYCIMLSGPEPQRTLLEEKILSTMGNITGNILLVRGKPDSTETIAKPANTTIVNHLIGNELNIAIQQSEYIISRSGYTTVMELLALQKKAILIPTPGQTEQEYLAQQLMKQQWCYAVQQNEFDMASAISIAKKFEYQLPIMPQQNLSILIPQLIEMFASNK